jgi:hypothetical protein
VIVKLAEMICQSQGYTIVLVEAISLAAPLADRFMWAWPGGPAVC